MTLWADINTDALLEETKLLQASTQQSGYQHECWV
jgi:hypothetical protein